MYFFKNYRTLRLISDQSEWSISEDMRQLAKIAQGIGINTIQSQDRKQAKEAIFYGCQFAALTAEGWSKNDRIGMAYFHGIPGSGYRAFDECFDRLVTRKNQIHRIQVTHTETEDLMLNIGISKEKIHKIPIGIDLERFFPNSEERKKVIREQLEIPSDAFVVGSFQKDGNGWGEGLEPKLIKGPDVFLEVVKILKKEIPNLWILLSGPSRGFVKKGLESLNIPYRHCYFKDFSEIPRLYHALDLYLVTSRQEGGPKAVLESMASAVSIVSTKVGQGREIIKEGINGYICNIEDVSDLSDKVISIYSQETLKLQMIQGGLSTAIDNSYNKQIPMWKRFFKGFVD